MEPDNNAFTIENDVLKGSELPCSNDFTSLGEFVLDRLGSNEDSIGQIDASTGEEWTCGKIRERSVRCALWMKSQGVRARDVVAICSEICLDYTTPCFAALYLGAAFSPWDVAMKTAEFCHHAEITKPKIIFVSEDAAATIAEAIEQKKLDSKVVVFGRNSAGLEFENIIAKAGDNEIQNFKYVTIESLTEIATIFFSSGTTGLPKGVALSHGSLLRQLHLRSDSRQVVVAFGAAHWVTVILITFRSLFMKVPKILAPPFEECLACALIERYRVNWVFLTPAMINGLLDSEGPRRYDLSSLSQVVHGGSKLSNASYEALVKLLPNVLLCAVYGMTELGGFVSIQSSKSKPNSCGQIVNNIQLKVIDPDTGRTLGVDQRGELLLKTPYMMNFYYGNPDATAKTVDEQGWLHSGDLGYYDRSGEVFLVERLKELIKYREDQIAPSEIENVILSHSGVKETSVVGVSHLRDGEHPVAFVVRKNDSTGPHVGSHQVTESELIELVATKLSDYKRLRGGVRFVDRIPRTSTGKVLRKVLRDLAESTVTG